jgi:hypothetical protein
MSKDGGPTDQGEGGTPEQDPVPAITEAEGEYYVNLGLGRGIYGAIDEDGMLAFKINTEDTGVRGTDLFDRMMQHFGDKVQGVWGMWPKGTNLDKVNELTAQGITLQEAVTRTWTANRARAFGFSKAIICEEPVGTPGAYTKVLVKFVPE